MKRALISVWDKSGLEELARFLHEHDFNLISTGGTARKIEALEIPVTPVEEITGQPAFMDGRLKTLDLRVFGPILFDRKKPEHARDLEQLGQGPIDLVVVNLYPFEEMMSKGLSKEEMIEYIDIGGPSLLRAAAKNYAHVMVLFQPEHYPRFQQLYLDHNGDIPPDERERLATEVFRLTAAYDRLIGEYFAPPSEDLSATITIHARRHQSLRYGENPHQQAGFYLMPGRKPLWTQLHGKELSFNNYTDTETAHQIVSEFEGPAAVIVKHANPCGFGRGETMIEAYQRALSTDPVSSFGGIVAFNGEVDEDVAGALVGTFLECVAAPAFTSEALIRLTGKKNLRILQVDAAAAEETDWKIRSVAGGLLVQNEDRDHGEDRWEVVTQGKPSRDEMEAMRLGWKIVKFVKSNAIIFNNLDQLLGVGAGQMSRVDAVVLAGMKAAQAKMNLAGAVMASDAFFPFPDGVEEAVRLGITAIIQPGGSVRDPEVIDAANVHKVAMIFTHTRHFRH